MDFEFYKNQIARLVQTFGEKSYPGERVSVLWEYVRSFDQNWFNETVSEFIANSRQAPLVKEFRDAAEKKNLAEWEKKKRYESAISKSFSPNEDSIFEPQDIRDMMKYLTARMDGKVSDEDWNAFQQYVTETASKSKQKRYKCFLCRDSGYTSQLREIDGQKYSYAIPCSVTTSCQARH